MSCTYRVTHYGLLVEPGFRPSTEISLSKVLATSTKSILAHSTGDVELCQYRKGFFDHLKPRAFVVGTLRVVVQQGTLIMGNFMTEQLENDIRRTEEVEAGNLTPAEAEHQAEEWEKVEWEKRWQTFPSKLFTAFSKYHVITLTMRIYELLASLSYDEIMMDKLTMDPFYASRRVAKETPSNSTIAKEMFYTTFWANLVAFLSDYTVHQFIICYGYYRYYQKRKQQAVEAKDKNSVVPEGAILSSFLKKSTQLFVARSFALFCTAVGGAMGTVWWPGWGTMIMSNMGEGVAGVVMDDGQTPPAKSNGN